MSIKEKPTRKIEARNENLDYMHHYQKLRKIYVDLEKFKNSDPSSKEVQTLIEKYRHYLSERHNYNYNAFKELGDFYEKDESLISYLNTYGDGFSKFLSDAIKIYCS